jgi:uroporphyrinogen-III decarboxylase
MERSFYIDAARRSLRFPIGADLVLKSKPDHESILLDGKRLGRVVAEAARKFRTPFAMPVMDLMLEKAMLLRAMGSVPQNEIAKFHFDSCPTDEQITKIRTGIAGPLDKRLRANIEAVRYISEKTDLIPVGMSIGPFSLMTKLISEPITPVYMAGLGDTGETNPDVKIVEVLLDLAVEMILRSFKAQAQAGAKAFFIAEPAANMVYISPKQMAAGSDVFDRMVLRNLRRIKAAMDEAGVDLFFHCCGELTNEMLKSFTTLRPVLLSLGSSRKLWEDAAIVPGDIVLYGNVPSKRFYSDELISVSDVRRMSVEFIARMKATGHPYILGTECDVLSVPGCEKALMAKAMALVNCIADNRDGVIPFPADGTKFRTTA